MSALYAGIGCRRGCSAEEILALLAEALQQAGAEEITALASSEHKRDEAGLAEAAAKLKKPLKLIPAAELEQAEPAVETHSPAAEKALGLPSVAEAAALAAAGPKARLRLRRLQSAQATCALAETAS